MINSKIPRKAIPYYQSLLVKEQIDQVDDLLASHTPTYIRETLKGQQHFYFDSHYKAVKFRRLLPNIRKKHPYYTIKSDVKHIPRIKRYLVIVKYGLKDHTEKAAS